MTFGLLHLAMLCGLIGLSIPVLIHFWNRRRAPVIDWGAMMFLDMHPAQRRRLLLEEILLLLARLAAVAAIVLALAGPFLRGPAVAAWTRPPRDVVFVVDAAAVMARRDVTPSPWESSVDALETEIRQLGGGDRWTIVTASRPVGMPLTGWQNGGGGFDRETFAKSVIPSGTAAGPAAVERAIKILDDQGRHPQREIVVLSDGLRAGWGDTAALGEWERLASRFADPEFAKTTTLRYQAVAAAPKTAPHDVRVASFELSRRTVGVGQRVRLQAKIASDQPGAAPTATRLLIDGDLISETEKIEGWDATTGTGDVRFEHVFRRPGPHLVRVEITPPKNDALAADDHREMVVDVAADFPVLVVDGSQTLNADSPAYFLMQAFADPADKNRVSLVTPRWVASERLRSNDLADPRPRVVVLADVPALDAAQAESIERFLQGGGGVMVVCGPRMRAEAYRRLSWLPCGVDEIVRPKSPVGIDDTPLSHPAFRLFTRDGKSRLADLRFGGYWRLSLDPQARASALALFTGGDPWLVEKSVGPGRVLVSAAPMDRSWDGTLAASWEFPVLVHELIDSLADRSDDALNLPPGEPVRLGPDRFTPPWRDPPLPLAGVLQRPGGTTRPVLISSWPGIADAPGPAGAYRLQLGDRPPLPIVVRDELDLDWSPLTDDDKARITRYVPIRWNSVDAAEGVIGQANVGRWLFVGLLAFLCLETWLARQCTPHAPRA